MLCSSDVVFEGGGADLPIDLSAPVGVTPSVEASAGTICLSDVDAALPFPFVLAIVAFVVVFDFCNGWRFFICGLTVSSLIRSIPWHDFQTQWVNLTNNTGKIQLD